MAFEDPIPRPSAPRVSGTGTGGGWYFGKNLGDIWKWLTGGPQLPAEPDWDALSKKADEEAAAKLAPVYKKISDIEGMAKDIPSFEEWAASQGITLNTWDTETAGMQGLIDQLGAGPTQENYDFANEQSAQMLGFESNEAAQALMAQLAGEVAGDPYAQQGLSDEEMAMRAKANQQMLREMEARQKRLVENSYADTGSTIRMMQTADESLRMINNEQIQQQALLIKEDGDRAIAQYNAKKETYQRMLENREITSAQYIEALQQGQTAALQGYAQKINALYQENQSYFQQYAADLQALTTSIDAMFKAAQLELGVTQAELDMSSEFFDKYLAPYHEQLNRLLMEQELAPDWMGILGIIASFAATVVAAKITAGA